MESKQERISKLQSFLDVLKTAVNNIETEPMMLTIDANHLAFRLYKLDAYKKYTSFDSVKYDRTRDIKEQCVAHYDALHIPWDKLSFGVRACGFETALFTEEFADLKRKTIKSRTFRHPNNGEEVCVWVGQRPDESVTRKVLVIFRTWITIVDERMKELYSDASAKRITSENPTGEQVESAGTTKKKRGGSKPRYDYDSIQKDHERYKASNLSLKDCCTREGWSYPAKRKQFDALRHRNSKPVKADD